MAKQNSFYKCEVCGNVVSVVDAGAGTLVCCGQEMKELIEKDSDEGQEKHVPVVKIEGNRVEVRVGEVAHPMQEEHYISLIQLVEENNVVIGKRLKPGDEPVAVFHVDDVNNLKARIYCNIHGLWKSK